MGSVSTNEMKSGTKVLIDGNPFSVVDNEYRKPGKGQATNCVKVRNLKNGRVIDITLKSGDTLEAADVEDVELQYLYNDGEFWTFMNPEDFEQTMVSAVAMADAKQWIKGEEIVRVTMWNGMPLTVTPPNFVELAIAETDPGMRGDTVTGGTKPAIMETGASVKVPLFLNVGDVIKIDTRTGEYLNRAK